MNSSKEQFYLNITANHDLEETTSNTTFIEINRTASAEENGDTGQSQNSSILSAYHGLDELPFLANPCVGLTAGDDGMPVVSRRNCRSRQRRPRILLGDTTRR